MKKIYFLFLNIIILFSCGGVKNNQFDDLVNQPENSCFKKYDIFNDKNYLLTLTTIDTTDSYDYNKPTVVLCLLKKNKNNIDTLLNDYLFSRNSIAAIPEIKIEFIDFNFDGINDIALPAGTDPRGNYGYHLYLIDSVGKSLKNIVGFNKIGNPKPDSKNKLITSFVLSGPPFCKFYQIDSTYQLVDLEHYIEFRDFLVNIDSLIQKEAESIIK
jgi:hypothetical protein